MTTAVDAFVFWLNLTKKILARFSAGKTPAVPILSHERDQNLYDKFQYHQKLDHHQPLLCENIIASGKEPLGIRLTKSTRFHILETWESS